MKIEHDVDREEVEHDSPGEILLDSDKLYDHQRRLRVNYKGFREDCAWTCLRGRTYALSDAEPTTPIILGTLHRENETF